MTETRISIAMASYNGARYLSEQLESLAAQRRLPDELVVCDDASEDDTLEVLESFAAAAPFAVRIERNEQTLRTAQNFAKAVSLCSGELIFLADQDDAWRPDKLQVMESYFDAHPQVGALFCNGQVCDGELRPLGYDLWQAQWFHPSEQRRVREGRPLEVFVRHSVAAGNTLAFRSRFRELVLPITGLDDGADTWIAFLIAAVSEFHIMDRDLVQYRLHGANQIGLRRFDLRQQLERARWQLQQGIFDYGVRFFSGVEDRLSSQPEPEWQPAPETLELVREKIAHCRTRDRMSPQFLTRLPDVARETLNRGYWRFSYGLKSLLQDLLLR